MKTKRIKTIKLSVTVKELYPTWNKGVFQFVWVFKSWTQWKRVPGFPQCLGPSSLAAVHEHGKIFHFIGEKINSKYLFLLCILVICDISKYFQISNMHQNDYP